MTSRREFLAGAMAGSAALFARNAAAAPQGPKQIKGFCVDFNWGGPKREGWPNAFAAPGVWADASPERHVAWYEALGANVIQTFAVSCNGYAWYKDGPVPPQPGLESDFLTEMVNLGHARNMLVMAYFCAAANTRWGLEHPDLSYDPISDYHIPFTDAYLDYLGGAIEDAVRRTGIDGFMIDWLWNPKPEARKRGWLGSEKQLFEQLTRGRFPDSGEPAPQLMLAYERSALNRCWGRIREAARGRIVWLSCNKLTDPSLAGSPVLRECGWVMNEHPDPSYRMAVHKAVGPHTRLVQCVLGWKEHDTKAFLSAPENRHLDIYGFAAPSENSSLPLDISEYLAKAPESFSNVNDRNIAALARFYRGMKL